MTTVRNIGSVAFVLGLFTAVFAGLPWYVVAAEDPAVPWWLRLAIFALLGGVLLVLAALAVEQKGDAALGEERPAPVSGPEILLTSSAEVSDRQITEVLGLVQGHTVYAIWLGKDLSAIVRLILGGELTEYTEMMGRARATATDRMIAGAREAGADAIINVRYMTTSVVGSAAELLAYGTAVKLGDQGRM
jgi:uncharacterized protein YbjQ (UPF0145 family)